MNYVWIITVGFIVGLVLSFFPRNNGLGRIGCIVTGILGSLTGDFFTESIGATEKIGIGGTAAIAIASASVFIYFMRKISNSF